ncbi:MAG: arylsulfatase [Tannerella sp.]|jgi:arylsulfatase|nr:arylsulfatase [Tannerella sp.]
MKTLITCGIGVLAASTLNAQQSRKPNIIYILADDLGYGELGCYGQTKIETPNIDRLADSGIRFTQNYTGSPVSAPSRCVTLTGLHTGHSIIRGNDEAPERGDVWNHAAMLADSTLEGQRPMPAGTVTIASLLHDAGYHTACVGKWGLGYPGSESTPLKVGYDFFYGYNCQRQAHTYFPPFLYRNEQREYLTNKLLPPGTKLDDGADIYDLKSYAKFTQNEYSPELMYNEILKFIADNKSQPFFLAWTTTIPHVALQAPERWARYYVDKFGDEEPYTGAEGYFPCRYPHATYAAMVSYLDEQIGGLIAHLKELGVYDNTIIIFTSDNGPAYNSGTDSPWFDSARPFRSESGWGKGHLHEGGIRAPLIVAWEGHIRPGRTSEHICASWDIPATLCDFAGIKPPKTDGISFRPELLGKKQPAHKYLYWEFEASGGQQAVRYGKWKGLRLNINKERNLKIQLYDLETDPRETTDLAAAHPDIVEKITRFMATAHTKSPNERFHLKALDE